MGAIAIVLDELVRTGDLRDKIQILGPIEAAIQKISSRFRWQILIKSHSSSIINHLVKSMLMHPKAATGSGISIAVDVDPYFLM